MLVSASQTLNFTCHFSPLRASCTCTRIHRSAGTLNRNKQNVAAAPILQHENNLTDLTHTAPSCKPSHQFSRGDAVLPLLLSSRAEPGAPGFPRPATCDCSYDPVANVTSCMEPVHSFARMSSAAARSSCMASSCCAVFPRSPSEALWPVADADDASVGVVALPCAPNVLSQITSCVSGHIWTRSALSRVQYLSPALPFSLKHSNMMSCSHRCL